MKVINRPPWPSDAPVARQPSAEEHRLCELVNGSSAVAVQVSEHFPGYNLLEREVTLYSIHLDEFPPGSRLLLDDPLETPALFPITCECELSAICAFIADAYSHVYANAASFGVSLHDLSDLVIEDLVYYPAERLLYPHIGS